MQSAHMAVMEGLMGLFVKEVVAAEKVVNAIRRFADLEPGQSAPKEPEQALLLWISKACQALKRRLEAEGDVSLRLSLSFSLDHSPFVTASVHHQHRAVPCAGLH